MEVPCTSRFACPRMHVHRCFASVDDERLEQPDWRRQRLHSIVWPHLYHVTKRGIIQSILRLRDIALFVNFSTKKSAPSQDRGLEECYPTGTVAEQNVVATPSPYTAPKSYWDGANSLLDMRAASRQFSSASRCDLFFQNAA